METDTTSSSHQRCCIRLHFAIRKDLDGWTCPWAYLSGQNTVDYFPRNLLTGCSKNYGKDDTDDEYELTDWDNDTIPIVDKEFLDHILYFMFPNYIEDILDDLCYCDLIGETYKAMPKEIIDNIAEEINGFGQIGKFDNDLYQIEEIDRMEKCVVENEEGLRIDLNSQLRNIKKL